MQDEISRYRLQLRRLHPFFATLALFIDYRIEERYQGFSCGERSVTVGADYFRQLDKEQRIGTLLHATLHVALLHAQRRGARDLSLWNLAADIVVNNLITEAGHFAIPPLTAHDRKFADYAVEEVYEALQQRYMPPPAALASTAEASDMGGDDDEGEGGEGDEDEAESPNEPQSEPPPGSPAAQTRQQLAITRQRALTRYPHQSDLPEAPPQAETSPTSEFWRGALIRAETAERLHNEQYGRLPAGLQREVDALLHPQIDWRTQLWRYLSRTPLDFNGYDRRFIHQGLYLDALQDEENHLTALIAVDTSGSIADDDLRQFLTEVDGIRNAYPSLDVKLYFVDCEIDGPHPLEKGVELPSAVGGGGTSFAVFFRHIHRHGERNPNQVIIYLTDGDGEFPKRPPEQELLWVVTPGGKRNQHFPFGEVLRLANQPHN